VSWYYIIGVQSTQFFAVLKHQRFEICLFQRDRLHRKLDIDEACDRFDHDYSWNGTVQDQYNDVCWVNMYDIVQKAMCLYEWMRMGAFCGTSFGHLSCDFLVRCTWTDPVSMKVLTNRPIDREDTPSNTLTVSISMPYNCTRTTHRQRISVLIIAVYSRCLPNSFRQTTRIVFLNG